MNKDSIAFENFPGDESIVRRARLKAQKILYYFLTGYWNTGERLHPLFVTNNFVNHLRVYQFVSQFAKEKRVLDVGCGVGYGTAFLSRTASRCVGIDLSRQTIYEAFRLYPSGEFLEMDAEKMSFDAESFDMIVSTENFEHLPNQERHLQELARVVQKDGICFIATPNPELFVGENNPYHTKENTFTEMRDLLSKYFGRVEIIEPTRIPENSIGRAMREKRFALGEHGKIVAPDLEILGMKVDQTFLSNTHSFNCFVREPLLRR
jgi:2-polyprenyl-3-methyl-5-hydroxy-6-metoxy-1,4-benzoquinol methylase